MKNKAVKILLSALLAMVLCLGLAATHAPQSTYASDEVDQNAMVGIEIKSVLQTDRAKAKSDVLIPAAQTDFSKLRYLELEVCNPTDTAHPFSIYLQDKMDCRTLGCYGGIRENSYDEWTLIASDGTEITEVGYYNCTYIPAGFSGKIRLPICFFKSNIEFIFDKRPGMMFDYHSVEYIIISVDQYYNPAFCLQFGDVVLVTANSSVTVRDGALQTEGIIVQDNQEQEGTYTTVTALN